MTSSVPQKYLIIIKKHFPEVIAEEITTHTKGNDHYVFVVKNQVTFRFPRVERIINPKRSAFLQELAHISPLPIPTIEIHTDPESNIYYEMNTYIPGESFYPAVAGKFSHQELMGVAQKLGEFLSVVHSFPLAKARELQLDEMNPADFWEYMSENPHAYPEYKKVTFPHLTKDEQTWVETLFTDYIDLIHQTPFETNVTHSDMWTYHIIVDANQHTLSGLIDFWGRIADPAHDFKAFEYYGSDFVKEVYAHYAPSIDPHFEKRRLFYTGHDEVFEFSRQLKKGNSQKIADQYQSLSHYISTHPM